MERLLPDTWDGRAVPLRLFLATAVLLLAAPPARGAVFNVTTPTEFQNALTTAQGNSGADTINVAAGTYSIATTLSHIPTGVGESLQIAGDGAATTILDGGGAVRVMDLQSDGDVSVSGLTIRNGSVFNFGGGIAAEPVSGTFTLTDSTLSGNTAGFGGGLSVDAGTVVIDNAVISNNSTTQFGAVGGVGIFAPDVSITDSVISGNSMHGGNDGSGVRVQSLPGGTFTFTGNTVSGNHGREPCDDMEVDRGMGIFAEVRGPVLFARNLITDNTTPCNGSGSGVYLYQRDTMHTMTVADNILAGNSGGAASVGPAIRLRTRDGILNVVNNTFSGNDSGVAAETDVRLQAYYDGSELNVSNNIFFGDGGTDSLEITNDTDNNLVFATTTLSNNILDPSSLTLTPGGGVTQSGNFFADPLFADRANGDFHISESSPAIDAGLDTAPGIQLMDFNGDNRPLDTAVDIGADEFRLPPIFYPVPELLSLDEVQLGGGNLRLDDAVAKAYAVELARLDQTGFVFELVMSSIKKTMPSANPGGTFDTKTGILDIPVLKVIGLKTTYHVKMKKRKSGFVFDLTSAKKN